MSLKKLFVFLVFFFTFLFVAAPDVQACHYRYMVGWYVDSSGTHGFRYKKCDTSSDSYDTLDYTDGIFTAPLTKAFGVNESGHVVGFYEDSSGDFHGFYWDGSDYIPIDYPNAEHTYCIDINNDEYIVGYYEDSYGDIFGFLYDGDNFTPIGVHFIPDADPFETFCTGLNENEEIVGRYIDSSGDVHGFLYDGTDYYSYDYPNAEQTWGRGINNNGYIVGSYEDSSSDWHGYEYDGSDFDPIDYPDADNTHGRGINDDRDIVGYYSKDGSKHGFICEDSSCTSFDYPGTGVIHTRLMDITDWFSI